MTMTNVPTAAKRRRADGDDLGDELLGIAVEEALVRGLDGGRGEDAGRDRTEHPADPVDREDVERIIDLSSVRGGASRCSRDRRRRDR